MEVVDLENVEVILSSCCCALFLVYITWTLAVVGFFLWCLCTFINNFFYFILFSFHHSSSGCNVGQYESTTKVHQECFIQTHKADHYRR
jgi:hypothetical protein